MALSKRNKRSPPEELPDLAIDELKNDMKSAMGEGKKEEEVPVENTPQPEEQQTIQEPEATQETPQEETEEIPAEEVSEENSQEETEEIPDTGYKMDPEKSYFNSLLKELGNKEADISKLNEWYHHKFPQGNALDEMKEYWKEKKEEIILENIGKDLKTKIDFNMKQLQKLEGEWQKIYFDLMSKEDEMKNQEKKLKEIIREFTEVFKKKGNIKKTKKK